ncbi:MAG TPA: ScyD/ScyE family protein [Mycobacteriales bacterium]
MSPDLSNHRHRPAGALLLLAAALIAITVPAAAPAGAAPTVPAAAPAGASPTVPAHRTHLLTAGLRGALGSTVGPDGALYVVEGAAGRISRVDARTGRTTTFASGLPRRILDTGGAMDVAFVHHRPYVLVTLVGPDVGGSDIDGIYRVDGPNRVTVVADIGAWSLAHPPVPEFFVPTGVQYALEPHRGGFLVTDGHHNRLLRVEVDGDITELAAFPNVVPTGITTGDRSVYLAQAGPVPHAPSDGKVLRVEPRSRRASEVASGAPLLVDVEFGRDHRLYALSQGHFTPGNPEGSPADPATGTLVRVNRDGTMTPVAGGLDRPTSLEFIRDTAYVVTLTGEIWTIDCR